MAEQTTGSKGTIVLIHGLWMTPLSWEEWIPYLEGKGYKVIAPGWPGVDDRTPEQIRADPGSLASAGIETIVDKYASIISALPSPPIIIGHSFGGLFYTDTVVTRSWKCWYWHLARTARRHLRAALQHIQGYVSRPQEPV